jgi:hypothetical protein
METTSVASRRVSATDKTLGPGEVVLHVDILTLLIVFKQMDVCPYVLQFT